MRYFETLNNKNHIKQLGTLPLDLSKNKKITGSVKLCNLGKVELICSFEQREKDAATHFIMPSTEISLKFLLQC